MEAMRESWTDDRLDDLNGKVDALRLEMRTEFRAIRGETKGEFRAIRGEMKEGFDRIDDRLERMEIRSDQRFEAMMDRLYAMHRLMFQFCSGALIALIGFMATQI